MLKALLDAYRKNARYKETRKELSRLSDRELDDMGIDRSMITRVSLEAAYGDSTPQKPLSVISMFKPKTDREQIEEYLAESASAVDLENRLREIDRGTAPWQISARHFAQGLAQ